MIKKGWVLALILSMLLAPYYTYAQGSNDVNIDRYIGVANHDDTSMHSGAATNYRVVDKADKNQPLAVIGKFTNSSQENWLNVQLDGLRGWVKEEEVSAYTFKSSFLFTNKETKVHSGALPTYRVVATVPEGESLQTSDIFLNQNSEIWYRVKAGDAAGWALSSNLTQQVAEKELYITKDNTSLRRGASESYAVTATLSANQKVTGIDSFTDSSESLWYRVKLSTGQTGWVEAQYVQDHPLAVQHEDTEFEAFDVYAKEDKTTIHRGAMDTYAVIHTASRGAKLHVIDSFTHASGELWYRVEVSPTVTGWVKATGTTTEPVLNKVFYVTTDDSNIRSGASTNYKVVSVADRGNALRVVDQIGSGSTSWYRVQVDSTTFGWIHASLMSEDIIYMNKAKVIGTQKAILRKGAEYRYPAVQSIPLSSKVTAKYEFINIYGEKWLNIQLSNGKTGWVPSYEVYDSLAARQMIYPTKSTVLRKGASSSYGSAATVKTGESMIYLWSFGDWMNVETSKGIRGWILTSDTAKVVANMLKDPTVAKRANSESLITWKKSKNFSLKYSILSNKAIQVTGSSFVTELPGKVTGVSSISASSGKVVITPEAGYALTIRNYSDKFTVKVTKAGLSGKRILLDPGHGGHDPGAIGPTGLHEADVVLSVATKYLKQELESQGAIVTLTRSTDKYLTLDQRTTLSAGSEYDAFVSIHNNAASSSARGTEVFYNTSLNFNGPKSVIMAKYVQSALVSKLGTYNRGYKPADYYVLRHNVVPAILVEIAFISNRSEEALLRSSTKQKVAAQGIAQGLTNYFNGGY